MSLWLLMGVMLLVAIGFVAIPILRETRQIALLPTLVIAAMVVLSAGLYAMNGSPDVPSGASEQPDPEEMVNALASRLREQPDDVDGWLMLARSYTTLERYAEAAAAYEQVLQLQPDNPQALFYGGYIAAGRGELSLAADRWQRILDLGNAPADVRDSLQEQIDNWRSDSPVAGNGNASREQAGTVVEVSVALDDEVAAVAAENAAVFIIARDPANPRPPIAVLRRTVAELPLTVSMGDGDSMVPGRYLSAYSDFEIVVRVSRSGNAMPEDGDWFGSQVVSAATPQPVDIVVDQRFLADD